MRPQLIMAVVVEAFDGGLLDRAVHPFDLAIGPRVFHLGQPVIDVVFTAYAPEDVLEGAGIDAAICELHSIVGQHRVDPVWRSCDQVAQKLGCSHLPRLLDEANEGKLAGSVNCDKEIELPFGGLHLGNIDVKEADRIVLELRPFRFVAIHVGQSRDAVTLKAPMQRRACQVRDGRLQGIKAVVQRQQRMAPKRNDGRLLGLRQDRRTRLRRTGLHILDRRALAPLRNRLGIDAQFPAQLRERSLRSLYCCSDSVRGRGAAVTNLSHRASFHSKERRLYI